MTVVEWSEIVKTDLVKLQQQTGIPALFAVAQMAHESAINDGKDMSRLAMDYHNYAGLKWASWQTTYGCSPVSMGTFEYIDGQRADVTDAFCSCPTWEIWLQVYAALLTGSFYKAALRYKNDPLLYGTHVWRLGWATDPAYIAGIAGWMSLLWAHYADALPMSDFASCSPVSVMDGSGRRLCTGFLKDSVSYVPVRPLAEAMGLVVGWTAPVVTLRWPGSR